MYFLSRLYMPHPIPAKNRANQCYNRAMPGALQKTKLYPPPSWTGQVERPCLLARLDGLFSRDCRFVLISAPAGSGKTTLMVQWLTHNGSSPLCCAWLSLDERDNHPARFFSYLIAALQTHAPAVGQAAQELLQLPAPDLDKPMSWHCEQAAGANRTVTRARRWNMP